jgi:hypothetical protein
MTALMTEAMMNTVQNHLTIKPVIASFVCSGTFFAPIVINIPAPTRNRYFPNWKTPLLLGNDSMPAINAKIINNLSAFSKSEKPNNRIALVINTSTYAIISKLAINQHRKVVPTVLVFC